MYRQFLKMAAAFTRVAREIIFDEMMGTIVKRLPRSGMIHNVLKLFEADRYSHHIKTRFYAYEGHANSVDKSFIVATQHRSFFGDIAITTSEPENPTPEMIKGFEDFLDWKTPMAFKTTFNGKILRDWCSQRGSIVLEDCTYGYYMNIEDALKVKPTPVPGYKIGMLKPEHGVDVARNWPFSCGGSAANMIDSIDTVFGVGVYDGKTLCAWIIQSTNGQIYAFHVDPNYRKQGLGEWVLGTTAKVAAQHGLFPNALVVTTNDASRKLFEKLGYKRGNYMIQEVRYCPENYVYTYEPVVTD